MNEHPTIRRPRCHASLVRLLIAVCTSCLAAAQMRALETCEEYGRVLEMAEAKQYEAAYSRGQKHLREDPLCYRNDILRIALATILKRTGAESPANFKKSCLSRAPLGSDIDHDVNLMLKHLLEGDAQTPTVVNVSPFVRRRLGLVVGIGAFNDPRITSLRFAGGDATALAAALKDTCRFSSVRCLTDKGATTAAIKTEIDNIAREATAEDLVVLFMSSHGSPSDLDTAGVNYVLTYDTDIDRLYATSLQMDEVLDCIRKRIKAERIVCFLDTCFSGGTFKELPPGWRSKSLVVDHGLSAGELEKELQQRKTVALVADSMPDKTGLGRAQGVGRVVIASSRQNEKSWEDERIQHGYFTHFLLMGLKASESLTLDELYEKYLLGMVPVAVKRDKNADQHPTIARSYDGTMTILIRDDTVNQARQP